MTLKSHSLTQDAPAPKEPTAVELLMPTLETMSEVDLQELRHQVDLRLQLDLGNLDLAEELGLQFRQGKALLHEVQIDKDTPNSQKAQVFNSVRSMLSDIVKQQESVWGMERLKKIEIAIVKALSGDDVPADVRVRFFDIYGEYLKDANAAGPVAQ